MAFSENAHAEFLSNNPLIDITVGIARVVAKTPKISLLSCVHKFALAEGHEVEMFDPLSVILPHAAMERTFVNDLPDVLENKLMRPQILFRAETIALLVGFDYSHARIFSSLESLVLAIRSTTAVAHALNLRRAVDTIRVLPTSSIRSTGGI